VLFFTTTPIVIHVFQFGFCRYIFGTGLKLSGVIK
jgi:hypothetical protein